MLFKGRTLSTREQARLIRQEAIQLVDKANEFSVGSRRVNRRAAYKVISRSLSQSRGLPFSIRKHKALTDLSNYISLAKHNKVIGLTADHTDLLPVSHPRSTKLHAMSASALVQAKIRWYIDDPRIKDDSVKSLVASAMSAPTDSAEYKYAITRLENLPATELPIETLTAAANPYAGKNSAAARRAREAVQLSDRFERWINMGRSAERRMTDGFRSYVRRNDGTTVSHSGAVLNQNMFSPQLIDIEVGKGRVATVPIKSGEGLDAFIRDKDSVDGFSQTPANPTNAPVIPESSIVFSDAPSIYRKEDDYRGKGTRYTDDKYDITRFDNPRDAMAMLDDSIKRSRAADLADPNQIKLGETSESGRQMWNPDEPIFAVARRGSKRAFSFSQTWKDVNNEILKDEPLLDEAEGRDYTRPEPKKEGDPDDLVPLLDQADQIFDGKKRKKESEAKPEGEGFPFTVPDRAYELDPTAEYTPEFDFDDPDFLAGVDTPDLEDALFRSVEPVSATERATGFAPVDLPDGRTEEVSAEAIAAALNAQGEDSEMALAKAYDRIAGNTKNQDDLLASRGEKRVEEAAEPKDLEEKFDEVVEEEPEVAPEDVIAEPAEDVEVAPQEGDAITSDDLDNVPAFKGLTDEEKLDILGSRDYSKYIPKMEDIDVPEGMYKPGVSSEEDKQNAIEMAAAPRSVAPNSLLTDKLKEAMENNGIANIPGANENGEEIDIPVSAESLRDAIALRGKDANAAVKKIAKPKKEKKEPEAAPAPVAEETPEAVEPPAEEAPKKQVTYKRAGKRTLLRGGKGAPFRDKDVADFLAENGFEWSDTIERDGKTIAVKAQTKLQDDEEFKAFARELRDRFGIDIQPRDGQEAIDIDAPTPEIQPVGRPEPRADLPDQIQPVGEIPEPEIVEVSEPEPEPAAPGSPPPPNEPTKEFVKGLIEMLYGKIKGFPRDKEFEDPNNKALWDKVVGKSDEEVEKILRKEAERLGVDWPSEEELAAWKAESDALFEEIKSGQKRKYLEELVNERRKIQDAIDEADLSDETTPEEKQALRDAYDELTRRIDAIVLGEEIESSKSAENQAIEELLGGEETPTLNELIDKVKSKAEDKSPFGSRKDMISKLMWFKWGPGFRRNESPYIRSAMRDYEKNLKKLSDEDMIDMLNLYYDEIDARLAEKDSRDERNRLLNIAREKKRKEKEDKLIKSLLEDGKEEKPASEEKPVASEEENKPEPTQTVELMNVRASELQPGDVLVEDHFTITKVEREGTKEVKVDGVKQEVPAYRITGYFPGSQEQASKLWSENYSPDIFRGATPPAKGDLPALNQPKAEDYGDQYKYPNQKAVKWNGRTLWAPKNPEAEAQFLKDYEDYDKERMRRKALWEAPTVNPENDYKTEGSVVKVGNELYTDSVPASEVKVGDIAFRRDKNGMKEFFVVTKVVGTKDGMTSLEGHYVGHQTQTKEWRSGTSIDVIRGETNLPAAGDKEPLDRPDKNLPNYAELEKARKEKIAEADKGYTPVFPTDTAFKGITPLAPKPQLPAFFGSAEELLASGDGPAIMAALDKNGFIVFDFETIGKDVNNSANPDAPIQVAAARFVNGEKVDSLNLFINPKEPLGIYYYMKDGVVLVDENGNRQLNPDRLRDSDGNPITDEWLATQPEIKEQLQKLIDFFGEKPILVGQNNTFDINLLERWAEKLGLNFSMAGAVDTKGIAKIVQSKEAAAIEFPENPNDKDTVVVNGDTWTYNAGRGWSKPNGLSALAQQLGVSTEAKGAFHDAAFDIDVTEKVLRKLMEKVSAGDIPTGGTKKYNDKYSKWLESRDQRAKDIAEIEAAKLLSGKASSLDDAVSAVRSASDEKVSVVDGEEENVTPKIYVSSLYNDKITRDWVLDPENTVFIPDARVKDILLGDFIVGENGNFQEVIGFADDEVDPGNAIKVIRADIEDGVILESRKSERPDGGTGFFLVGRLEGGIFRRIPNIGKKTESEVRNDMPEPAPIDETPKVGEKSEPVKGEPLTADQVQTVAQNAVDVITSGAKSEATIDEAVSGLNIDETIKDLVINPAPEPDSEAAGRPITSDHITADGQQAAKGDRIITDKGRLGTISVLLATHKSGKYTYTNYLKVQFDDEEERVAIPAKKVRIIGKAIPKAKASDILRPAGKTSTATVADVAETIRTIQSQPTPEGVNPPENLPDPEEFAKEWKEREAERNRLAEEMNFVATSPEVVSSIKANLPGKISVKGFMPNLKTGQPMDLTFGFEKPTARDLASYAEDKNISSPDDILVFRATPTSVIKSAQLATIKPDGTIVWKTDIAKQIASIDLKNALDNFDSPIVGIKAMAVMPEPEDLEDPEGLDGGSVTALGTPEDVYDYSRLTKNMTPTSEQKAILSAIMTGKNVVVRALAGTGKTSTLKLAAKRIADQMPDKKIQYIVFNRSVRAEAENEFPSNTEPRTADSLAFNAVPEYLRTRFNEKDTRKQFVDNISIGEALGVTATTLINKKNGAEVSVGLREIPALIREVMKAFVISEDDEISMKHLTSVLVNVETIPPVFLDYAKRWWADINDPNGKIRPNNGDMTKIWALTKPQFADGIVGKDKKLRKVNTVFYDEAQDINPVMAKVMREQKGVQVVYVGDSNQAIYGFRGAIDELDNVVADYDLPLTETFRFGPKIAGIANRFLKVLDSKYRIKGVEGKEGIVSDFVENPDVIITNTNGGGISAMLELLKEGKVVGVSEDTAANYRSLISSVEYLKKADFGPVTGRTKKLHDDLAGFSNWKEVLEAKARGENLGSASFLVNMLDKRSVKEIKDILALIEAIPQGKEPSTPFVPLKESDFSDGTVKAIGTKTVFQGGRVMPFKVTYEVKGKTLTVRNIPDAQFDYLLAKGFTYDKEQRVLIRDFENPADLVKDLNRVKRFSEGYKPENLDTEIITAHKSKGKQWKRVRIYDDFDEPDYDLQSGELILPSAEARRLAYVAVTRAEEALELGNLSWVMDHTSEADESPNLSPIENTLGMTVGVDPDPVTPEEAAEDTLSTAKKMDEKTEAVADMIISAIEKGVVPWRKPWDGAGFLPTSVSTGKAYQGTNVLVLWAAALNNNWSDNRWLTFNQAKKLGGFIKKGEKATSIIHWTPKFREIEKPDGTKEKQFYWTPPKVIQVFNVEQAEGIKLPPVTTRDPVPVSEVETTILESYTDHPEIMYKAGDRAFYTPTDDKITLPLREQFKSTSDFLETLIHELAHSTGHSSRLGKSGKRKELQDNYGDHRASRGEEELIAEISVALLAAELGFEIDWGNLASYAKGWLEPLKNDKSMIVVAAKQAQDAVNWMMGRRSTEEGSQEGGESTGQAPVGEGVGSEGQTGEQIAEKPEATPEATPEPNVGTEGQTGEEIAQQNVAKNRDTSIQNRKYRDPNSGEEFELWEDITYVDTGERGQDDPSIERLHGILADRLLQDGEYITDRAEIDKYIADTLEKYGYGKKFFALANKKISDQTLGPINEDGGYLEAAVGLANTNAMPDGDPLKQEQFPIVLVRSRGIKKLALLHEIAHLMEGSWKNGKSGGHNLNWYATFVALLEGEGFTKEANLLRFNRPLEEGDTGAINR